MVFKSFKEIGSLYDKDINRNEKNYESKYNNMILSDREYGI